MERVGWMIAFFRSKWRELDGGLHLIIFLFFGFGDSPPTRLFKASIGLRRSDLNSHFLFSYCSRRLGCSFSAGERHVRD